MWKIDLKNWESTRHQHLSHSIIIIVIIKNLFILGRKKIAKLQLMKSFYLQYTLFPIKLLIYIGVKENLSLPDMYFAKANIFSTSDLIFKDLCVFDASIITIIIIIIIVTIVIMTIIITTMIPWISCHPSVSHTKILTRNAQSTQWNRIVEDSSRLLTCVWY